MDDVAIFPGRLQPPHRDHLTVIEATLALRPGPLVVALLVAGGDTRDAFAAESDEHHHSARNPLTFLQRAELLESALGGGRARVRIVPLPRPECAWEHVTRVFPESRLWVVPDAGDPFDDAKARWFSARGERVLRPRVVSTTNGRVVRELLARGDPRLRDHVPQAIADRLLSGRFPWARADGRE